MIVAKICYAMIIRSIKVLKYQVSLPYQYLMNAP